MNSTQKKIIGWSLAFFVGMVVFPPWTIPWLGHSEVSYVPIFAPPSYGPAASICGPRLALQWFVLGVVCGGLLMMNKEPRIAPSTPVVPAPSDSNLQSPASPVVLVPQAQDSEGVKILKAICYVMGLFFLSTLILGLVLNAK